MNDATIAEFRTALKALRATLSEQDALGLEGRKTVTLDQQSVGRLSRMDALQHQAMAQATQARRDQIAQRIESAFARMEAGEFGFCVDCGDDIPLKRLKIDPTVATCVSCAGN